MLIRRPRLEALGVDTKAILEAAFDKHNGIVNVPDLLPNQFNPKPRTLQKCPRDSGVFHGDSGYDEYESDDGI